MSLEEEVDSLTNAVEILNIYVNDLNAQQKKIREAIRIMIHPDRMYKRVEILEILGMEEEEELV